MNPQEFGFFKNGWHEPEPSESFDTYCAVLKSLYEATDFVDDDHDKWRITNFVINETQKCMAWVEWCSNEERRMEKHEYYLCAITPSFSRLRKEIPAYNTYFGVFVDSISYTDGIVHLQYRDKHDSRQMLLDEMNTLL